MKSKKGIFSICVLLFVSLFLGLILANKRESYHSLLTLKIVDSKKQNNILNLEEIIKIQLKNKVNDPIILNRLVNEELSKFLNSENDNWYILNLKTNKKIKITENNLDNLSKTIILKPAENITIKRYTITNGVTKNNFLSFDIFTKCSKTTFSFPKNYSVEVIVIE